MKSPAEVSLSGSFADETGMPMAEVGFYWRLLPGQKHKKKKNLHDDV